MDQQESPATESGTNLGAKDNTGETYSNAMESIIPIKNPNALWSYYFGIFSLIPFIGAILAILAFVFGARGIKFGKENPNIPGIGHAYAGIIFGIFGILITLGFVWFIIWGAGPIQPSYLTQ